MIRFVEFEAHGLAVAAFSERTDGDCGIKEPLDPAASIEARRKVAQACGVRPDDLVCAQQVHGTDVLCAGEAERGRGATDWQDALAPADALVTNAPGLPLAVLVADCVPLYLFDPIRRTAALVHAGWRGTLDDIASRAVSELRRNWGSAPADIRALIGPSAGPCCYEVSQELADRFRHAGLAAEGRHADLWRSNALRLEAAGLLQRHILQPRLCTICDRRFFSHRRDADGRRSMALLML